MKLCQKTFFVFLVIVNYAPRANSAALQVVVNLVENVQGVGIVFVVHGPQDLFIMVIAQ